MPWREALEPMRMQRVAVVARPARLRDAAGAGRRRRHRRARPPHGREPGPGGDAAGPATALLRQLAGAADAGRRGSRPVEPDLPACGRSGRTDLVAGEAELESTARRSPSGGGTVAALAGWAPSADARRRWPTGSRARGRGGPAGGPARAGPADAAAGRERAAPVVDAAGADLRHRALRATSTRRSPAGLAYVVMFGMMFGDAGHGALLVLAALLLRAGRPAPARPLRTGVALRASAPGSRPCVFGLLYGEFFGPTGVLPVLWLSPLEEPVTLLASASAWARCCWPVPTSSGRSTAGGRAAGRWPCRRLRDRRRRAVRSGSASSLLGARTGTAAGWSSPGSWSPWPAWCWRSSGFLADAGGGAAGVTQAVVELFDTRAPARHEPGLLRPARRLRADPRGPRAGRVGRRPSRSGTAAAPLAGRPRSLVFVVGNAVAFTLEALVAGVQALRLEYYELFSRVFADRGPAVPSLARARRRAAPTRRRRDRREAPMTRLVRRAARARRRCAALATLLAAAPGPVRAAACWSRLDVLLALASLVVLVVALGRRRRRPPTADGGRRGHAGDRRRASGRRCSARPSRWPGRRSARPSRWPTPVPPPSPR